MSLRGALSDRMVAQVRTTLQGWGTRGRSAQATAMEPQALAQIVEVCKHELVQLWRQVLGWTRWGPELAYRLPKVQVTARRIYRDAAVLVLAFLGLLRPKELGALSTRNVEPIHRMAALRIRLATTKTSHTRGPLRGEQMAIVPMLGPGFVTGHQLTTGLEALLAWLQVRNESMARLAGMSLLIAPNITKDGTERAYFGSGAMAARLTAQLRHWVARAQALGVSLECSGPTSGLTSYSFRRGGASALLSAGASQLLINVLGRWTGDGSRSYFSMETYGAQGAARMFFQQAGQTRV